MKNTPLGKRSVLGEGQKSLQPDTHNLMARKVEEKISSRDLGNLVRLQKNDG
jgi:hypothetical protein